jgi:hypothetical protein
MGMFRFIIILFCAFGILSSNAQCPSVSSPQALSVCSGVAFNFAPTNGGGNTVPAGTTYTWTIASNPNVIGEANQANPQTAISQTLTQTSNSPVVLSYTVTPVLATCPTTSFTLVVTVNPVPVVVSSSLNVCSGNSFNVSPTNGAGNVVPTVTNYTWTASNNSNVTGEGNQASSQSSISQTLTNTTNVNQSINYVVTPQSGSCPGSTFTIAVTVNPEASIASTSATICSGNSFNVIPTNGSGNILPSGTNYTWTAAASGNVTGESNQATSQSSISQTLTNTTNVNQTVNFTVTPQSGSCQGAIFTIAVTVNPEATIAPTTATLCSGDSFTVSPTNGSGNIVPAGTNYTWSVVTSGNVTGEGNQTSPQSSISQLLTNTTNVNQTINYTVTPQSGSCPGSTFGIAVTVNPEATIAPTTATICSGNSFTISPSNGSGNIVPAGTNYTWTVAASGNVTGEGNQTTTQASISQTLNNTTNVSQTISYTVIPQSGTCSGASFAIAVTVNAKPVLTSNLQETICSEQTFTFAPQNIVNGIVPANTFLTWNVSNANVSGEMNNSNTGVGTISQTLTNTNYANNQVVYQVTPIANSCTGDPFNYTVTVNKAPNLIVTPSYTICQGNSVQLFAIDAFNTGQLLFNWSNSNTLNNGYIFNPIATPGVTTTYSVSATDNSTQCPVLRTINVEVSALPAATIAAQGSTNICQGNSVVLNANTGAGLSYQWRVNDIAIPNATSSTYTANSAGIYSLVVTNANGCIKTSIGVTVNVNSLPLADISNLSPTIFCEGDNVILNTTNVSGSTYQWKLNGVNIPNANLYSFSASQTGSFSVLVTNSNSCSLQSPSVNVTVHTLPILDVSSGNSELCLGESTPLLAEGALTYSWTPSSLVSNSMISDPEAFPTTTTNFGVSGTDQNGCSSYSEILIVVVPNPNLELPSLIEVCSGSEVSLPGETAINWSGITLTPDFIASESGYAIATLQNLNFCTSMDSIFIDVNLLPQPIVIGDTAVCANSYYSDYAVNPSGNLFSWNVSTGELQGTDNGNSAFIHWFDQEYGPSTFVTVTEHDIHSGCEGSDTLFLSFAGLASSTTNVSLLYPNGSTLFSADHYAIMNWGSTIIYNNVDEYTDGHAQYYTFDNFDTALRYYWIEGGDDSLCLTRSYFNAPVWQVGVQETTDSSLIRIYPNPTSDVLNLSVDAKNSICGFSIYDCTGHLVKKDFNFKNQSVIDVSELPVGFYILKANDNNGSNFNQTFIKQ